MGSIRYFASSSSASTSICASAAAFAAERMVTTASQTVMFFMPSSSARISFLDIPEENSLRYLTGKVIKLKDPQILKQFDALDKNKEGAASWQT